MKRDDRGHLLAPRDDGLAFCVTCLGGEIELEEQCASRCRRLHRDKYVLRALESLEALVIYGPEGPSGVRPAMMNLEPSELNLARRVVEASNRGEMRWSQTK